MERRRDGALRADKPSQESLQDMQEEMMGCKRTSPAPSPPWTPAITPREEVIFLA